ncbi:hypothetical protein EDD29_5273 [Actinocorallia herbida]|uniref:Lipoprotein n=1 Tax=Actinocorallia herbida TaxID=58109 RepID=A0A3N1D297_9ACTN|nr:hypothetical protein [Actinocorallia herbida]ROO87649.1 hypothetical protein EDD29_5273 [Actinocorallia herbida]
MRLSSALLVLPLLAGCSVASEQATAPAAPSAAPSQGLDEGVAATRPAGALSADEVVQGLQAAGYRLRDARDDTAQNCPDLGCLQLITTEDLSVYEFPTAPAARNFHGKWGEPSALYGRYVLSWVAVRSNARPDAGEQRGFVAVVRDIVEG